ncbi:unnamed protein product [Miscanthus lutarioriparius]|uniref:RuBisCO large subunit-binding protein subunit beta, chloroplastic n=1 Tax=Miscanthus lutarioriparius TaxID=422564 RepID=A0A811RUI2_9POAL|nr:unnamed protein product [Miscanthus lutarioriparius]
MDASVHCSLSLSLFLTASCQLAYAYFDISICQLTSSHSNSPTRATSDPSSRAVLQKLLYNVGIMDRTRMFACNWVSLGRRDGEQNLPLALVATEQEYEKEKLNERIAKLSGGVAVIQVGAQTETELKEKKLRVEDALNATKAAVEEGIVVGGGCTLLRLASKVDAIIETLENDEQKVGAEIVWKSLIYPLKLIAKNAGVNGSVVTEKVLANENFRYGYNAAIGKYEDLMAAGIIDPTKMCFCRINALCCYVVRCCLEHAASVAKTFITSDTVVVDIKEPEQAPAPANPMGGGSGGEGRRWRAGGRHRGGATESLVMCSTDAVGVDDDDHEKEDNDEERIEIGQPTDVPHLKMKESESPSMRSRLCELFNLAKEASKLLIIWCPTRRSYLG